MTNERMITGRPYIRISVRNLVEFVLRSGDIDSRGGTRDQLEAMQEGSRIHRRIQGSQGPLYHAEVPLSHIHSFDDYDLIIEGRADGIICDYDNLQPPVTIDEIKGIYQELELLNEPYPLHLAQAKCYAYMFAAEHRLSVIDVQITYCNLDTNEIRRFKETYSFEEISEWYEGVIALYKRWADYSYYWRINRQNSIGVLDFPYEYRPGQKDTAKNVYRAISRSKLLFIQAPTGSGKTLSTVFPSIMAVGQGLAERIFYLTAKTVTRTVARETFSLFYDMGYRAKTVEITAKDKLCPLEKRECDPDHCKYAKGHFDRINDAVFDLLNREDMFTREVISDWAESRMVCPFELNLDVSSWCDNIIADYNYVFDPNVYLKRFFGVGSRSEGIFLVDEAHNLVERAREMYSASLTKEVFLQTKKYFKLYNGGIPKSLDKCNKIMLSYKRQCDEVFFPESIDDLILALNHLAGCLQKFFETKIVLDNMDEIRQLYFDVLGFMARADESDEKYVIYCDYDTLGEFAIHLFCADPSTQLQQRLYKANAAVMFSATLLPINYYKKLLTTETEPYAVYATSSFDSKKRLMLIGTDVTSRYKSRGPEEYKKYAEYISIITSKRKGNYMIFFPSYKLMDEIMSYCEDISENGNDILIQRSQMSEEERDEFLNSFEKSREGSLIACCVLGGIFSEGIDLTGERLIGAVIVGAGLPQVSVQRRIIAEHFDKEREGFDYAYLYPGMNKVAQAAGRVIRTAEDVGIIALLDHRFTLPEYRRTFPREWGDAEVCNLETVGEKIDIFWKDMLKSYKL